MGATQSSDLTASVGSVIPEAFEGVHMELFRHTKVLSEITSLSYEDFKACLENLNTLSRKCIDPNGKQLVFLVKNGSDSSLLWKATVRIACIKVDPNTRKIESYKFLNLKQFLCVFKTFQSHLDSLLCSEKQRKNRLGSQSPLENNTNVTCSPSRRNFNLTASVIMEHMNSLTTSTVDQLTAAGIDECSICLDRSTDLILPCTHSFCTPCIEQWNKACPICSEKINSSDDMWVLTNIPGVEEINEEICAEFMSLYKSDKEDNAK